MVVNSILVMSGYGPMPIQTPMGQLYHRIKGTIKVLFEIFAAHAVVGRAAGGG
jgi:hypothetical protein